jgi:hypothetical protein
VTSIYASEHSWEVPIFIELQFIVVLASSIRKLDVKAPQFTNVPADFKLFYTVASLAPHKSTVSR